MERGGAILWLGKWEEMENSVEEVAFLSGDLVVGDSGRCWLLCYRIPFSLIQIYFLPQSDVSC